MFHAIQVPSFTYLTHVWWPLMLVLILWEMIDLMQKCQVQLFGFGVALKLQIDLGSKKYQEQKVLTI
jgi:hypothetical protein